VTDHTYTIDLYYLDHTHAGREYLDLPTGTDLDDVYDAALAEFGSFVGYREVYVGSVSAI